MQNKEQKIDYNDKEISKWIEVKGKQKYLEFEGILQKASVEVTWDVLKDTYRYDKRLLINIFKYLSFYEEFLRAQLWNTNQLILYKSLEKLCIRQMAQEIINQAISLKRYSISDDFFKQNFEYVNYLRNRVAHNKIMLSSLYKGKNLLDILNIFFDCMPCDYRAGFKTDINTCKIRLNVPAALCITI